MAFFILMKGLEFDGSSSKPALGLVLEMGDMARCMTCIVAVQVIDDGVADSQGLPVIRCPMCHRWRAARHVEGRDDDTDRGIA